MVTLWRVFTFLLFLGLFACTTEKSLQVGAAHASINPPMGAHIAGGPINRRFSSIHDSLFIKAVVVEKAGESVVLFTADCIGLMNPFLQEVRRAVHAYLPEHGPDTAHIVMSSTHTHSGPDVVGIWGPDLQTSGVDTVYLQGVVEAAARTIVKAWMNRRPARAWTAVTEHGRDWVHNICVPDEIDRSLTVIGFDDMEGHALVSMTNFSCHPTFLDAAYDAVSADYVFGFYEEMDRVRGGVNVFLQGSIGGWVQPEGQQQTFENAAGKGRGLALAVAEASGRAKQLPVDAIGFRRTALKLPLENPAFEHLSATGVIRRGMEGTVETEVAAFHIGSAWFVTHPGETSPYYGLETKKLMPGSGPKFVLGLGMDALGYILKPAFFNSKPPLPHAPYLTGMSVGPQSGPLLMQGIQSLFRELQP